MKILRWGFGVMAAVLISTGVFADDVSSLKAELADLKAKVASMEATQMAPAAGGDAESLTSMKKKGSIKIGGKVDMPLLVINRDDSPAAANGESDEIDSTRFYAEAFLDFEIKASNDMTLNIGLDLEDLWNETANQDDLLEECYFVWSNVAGSAWTINLGKKTVDNMRDKSVGYIDSSKMVTDLFSAAEENTGETAANLHAAVGTNSRPGLMTDNFQIEGVYSYKDLAKVYLTLFQSNVTTGNGRSTRGMHEDRSDDSMFFQSYAAKVDLTPMEGLLLSASFTNIHNDSAGDKDINGRGAEENEQFLSVAFDYSFKGLPLNIFGEYVHGWDWNFSDNIDTDTFQLGAIYGVTEAIDLGIEAEYTNIDSDNAVAGAYDDEDYWTVYMTAYYNFDSGIKVGLEYMHQWFDGNRKGASDLDADADMIGFVTSFEF